MTEKIILFGAGATGRGHVGLLAWQAGFEMVFVDKNLDLVKALQNAGHYTVKVVGDRTHEIQVSGYRVYHSEERQAIAQEIVDARLVLTAVFDQNLADVAQTLALAIPDCRKSGRQSPLNCIACENMMDSSSTLGRFVQSALSGKDAEYCREVLGFPDCMISRVVPQPESDPLVLITEDYNEWTARADAFKGEKPAELTALELVDNQTARLERKLFIHNGGHAVCGYVGFHRGHKYIHKALQDDVVVEQVLGALNEIGEVVRRKHRFSVESIDIYKKDLGRRGAIAEMRDEVLRVVRDPMRKLSPKERLVAPALLAQEYGLPRKHIVNAIVAALKYYNPTDRQSVVLSQKLEEEGLTAVLEQVCGIEPRSPLAGEISRAWDEANDTQRGKR